MRGLLGRQELPRGEGMLLRPAASVHTAFMRFAIDVVFLDADLRVVHLARQVPPWRVVGKRGAKCVVELPAGECSRRDFEVGDELVLVAHEPVARRRVDNASASPRA